MMILGLCGPAGSGKTTLANLLINSGWRRTRFATPIKSMLFQFLIQQGLDEPTVWRMLDGKLKEAPTEYLCGKTPRHAMQTLGTEWRDTIDKNLWVEAWKRQIRQFPDSTRIVVDDMRFVHEAEAVQDMGGKIANIKRSNTATVASHLSETEYKSIVPNFLIENNSTPECMLTQLGKFIHYW